MNYENEIKELYSMQQIYAAIFTITNHIQVQGDKNLEGITVRQFMTMLAILHLPQEETTFNRIAARMGSTKQNVHHIITGLEEKGLVTLRPSSLDRRAVNVIITEQGLQSLAGNGERSIYLMADLFSAFTSDELELLWKLLKKMNPTVSASQNGFEENVSEKIGKPNPAEEARILEEFKRLRKEKGRRGE